MEQKVSEFPACLFCGNECEAEKTLTVRDGSETVQVEFIRCRFCLAQGRRTTGDIDYEWSQEGYLP